MAPPNQADLQRDCEDVPQDVLRDVLPEHCECVECMPVGGLSSRHAVGCPAGPRGPRRLVSRFCTSGAAETGYTGVGARWKVSMAIEFSPTAAAGSAVGSVSGAYSRARNRHLARTRD